MSTKQLNLSIAALIALQTMFYLVTIREGHDWGGDFSMYILHAKNIAEGEPYAEAGYIYNPARPGVGPRTYPPVFPLLLAPIYSLLGLNLTAMKVLVILCFSGALAIFAAIIRDELPPWYQIVVIAIVGFNPFFWRSSSNVLSDFPFLYFTLLTLWLIKRMPGPGEEDKTRAINPNMHATLVGVAMYLAYGTRSPGIMLVPTLLVYDVIRHGRPSRLSGVALLVFAPYSSFKTTSFTPMPPISTI